MTRQTLTVRIVLNGNVAPSVENKQVEKGLSSFLKRRWEWIRKKR